jgi:hypothetical protein
MSDDADIASQDAAKTPEEVAVADRIAQLEAENAKLRKTQAPAPGEAPPPPEPKVGAVCNSCAFDSRQAPANPETGEQEDRDDTTEFGLRDLMRAITHNATWGHTLTIHDGDETHQFSPRAA